MRIYFASAGFMCRCACNQRSRSFAGLRAFCSLMAARHAQAIATCRTW